jgi:hypothetical protein
MAMHASVRGCNDNVRDGARDRIEDDATQLSARSIAPRDARSDHELC